MRVDIVNVLMRVGGAASVAFVVSRPGMDVHAFQTRRKLCGLLGLGMMVGAKWVPSGARPFALAAGGAGLGIYLLQSIQEARTTLDPDTSLVATAKNLGRQMAADVGMGK